MSVYIACGLAILVFFLFYKAGIYRRELKRISESIRRIEIGSSNEQLREAYSDKRLSQLILSINTLYEDVRRYHAETELSTNQLKNSMADLSHDLRTPLTSIIGYLNLIKKETDPKQQDEYLQIALERADSLKQLINSLFELVTLDAQSYQFTIEPVNLNALLRQEIAAFYESISVICTEPEIDIPERNILIMADAGAVQRIFENLIGNMVKYGKDSICIRAVISGDKARVVFKNGAEVLPQNPAQLFARGFTMDRTRNHESAGLGLAITQKFTEGCGGQISAAQEADQLCITVEWPLLHRPDANNMRH